MPPDVAIKFGCAIVGGDNGDWEDGGMSLFSELINDD